MLAVGTQVGQSLFNLVKAQNISGMVGGEVGTGFCCKRDKVKENKLAREK